MCRMAMFNKEGIGLVENMRGGLLDLLDHLEHSMGGHGNGYFIITVDGRIKIRKGINLTNEMIYEDVIKNMHKIKYFVYHTRLASIGKISTDNCHPFRKGRTVLCMNGTEKWTKPFTHEGETDTEALLRICVDGNKLLSDSTGYFNSAFFGYENSKVFMSKGYGSMEALVEKDAFVFASEFPNCYYYEYSIHEAPTFWEEGMIIKTDKGMSKSKNKKLHDYSYDYTKYSYKNVVNKSVASAGKR
jgi:predicted glutamine amidotransferase